MAAQFSKAGVKGKIAPGETSCGWNYAEKKGGLYYTALLTPAVADQKVCVVALDITFGTAKESTAFGMAPADTDLEAPLFKQKSICVERSPMAGGQYGKGRGTPVCVDGQEVGQSGLPTEAGSADNRPVIKGLLLVWRQSDECEHGEFGLFAPKSARDAGFRDGLPHFRSVPAGCTHFAITGVVQTQYKINQAFADAAVDALKGGDAAFAEWVKNAYAATGGCCVVA